MSLLGEEKMNPLRKLSYTRDHEWLYYREDRVVEIGITAYIVEQLGDIVHIELPGIGQVYSIGDAFATIESTKTVSDLYTPVTGKVLKVNENIVNDNFKIVQEYPYDKGWLMCLKTTEEKIPELLCYEEYEAYINNANNA